MSIETITLKRPILINGVERKEFTYDVEELMVGHIARAEGMKSKIGGADLAAKITFAQTDYPLQICMGMQAIIVVNKDVAEEDLMRIKGRDLAKLAQIGQSFFIESEDTSEANTSEKPQEDMQNTTAYQ